MSRQISNEDMLLYFLLLFILTIIIIFSINTNNQINKLKKYANKNLNLKKSNFKQIIKDTNYNNKIISQNNKNLEKDLNDLNNDTMNIINNYELSLKSEGESSIARSSEGEGGGSGDAFPSTGYDTFTFSMTKLYFNILKMKKEPEPPNYGDIYYNIFPDTIDMLSSWNDQFHADFKFYDYTLLYSHSYLEETTQIGFTIYAGLYRINDNEDDELKLFLYISRYDITNDQDLPDHFYIADLISENNCWSVNNVKKYFHDDQYLTSQYGEMIINASKLYDPQPITGVNIKYCIYESTGEGEGDASGGDAGDTGSGEGEGDTGSGEGEGEGSCQINGTYELVVVSNDQYRDQYGPYSIIVSVSSFTLENNNYDYTENTNFNDTLIETNTEDDFTYWKDMGLIKENSDFENIEATIIIYKNYNRDTYPVDIDYLYYNQEDCTFRSYYNNHNYYFRKTS